MIIKEKVTTLFGTKWNFVLYPVIIYIKVPSLETRRHEWAHVEQVRWFMEKHGKIKGWLKFYRGYAYQAWWLKLPHEQRSVEIGANEIQTIPEYAPWLDEYKNCPEKDRFNGVTLK